MDAPTMLEQKLCQLWARAESTGDWFGMFQELSDIADVLFASGDVDNSRLFYEAATQALDRRVYDLRAKEAA